MGYSIAQMIKDLLKELLYLDYELRENSTDNVNYLALLKATIKDLTYLMNILTKEGK